MIENKRIIVGIHQPNFLPWLGFFHKYYLSDIFIIADSVQQPKSHGGWTNRVFLYLDKEKKMITIPLNRKYEGIARVNEIKISKDINWERVTLKAIEYNYKKAPYFNDVFPVLSMIIKFQTQFLWEFNMNGILLILDKLGIDKNKVVIQSSLQLDHLWKADINHWIIEMVNKVGGNGYLSGDGSDGYQSAIPFIDNNIDLYYTKYQHPLYNQFNTKTFMSGLSITDALMNIGWKNTSEMIINSGLSNLPQKHIS